jgi:predicted nucleotidyltransferase
MIKEKEIIIRLLDALFPGVKIYLFGSRARGTHRPTSDIDLALDAGRELSAKLATF